MGHNPIEGSRSVIMDEERLLTIHPGSKPSIIKIADTEIPCVVLEDGTRILSEHGVTYAMKSRSGAAKRRKKVELEEGRAPLPVFMASSKLEPFISDELRIGLLNPIRYRIGRRIAQGYPAVLLPQICDVWLSARDAGVLSGQQLKKCKQAEILMRGLAHIGIIALVDEATGYQYIRPKEELQIILRAYISEELLPWTSRFPLEFYKEMFRLWGWQWDPIDYKKRGPRGPRYAGKLTNILIYDKLPPGVLDELKKLSPPNEKWQRKNKLHQRLTEDIGNRHLEKQVAVVTTLMRISPNRRLFKRSFERAFPVGHQQIEMGFMEDAESID